MKTVNKPEPTQGHIKMLRYIEDLIRNKNFKKQMKRLQSLQKYDTFPEGHYDTWTPDEQKRHDWINEELGSIIDGYESLRKRANNALRSRADLAKENIALSYGLDNGLIALASIKLGNDELSQQSLEVLGNRYMLDEKPDMCKSINLYDEELNPANKGEEIIYLRHDRQLMFCAYPVAIAIHQRASQRDVLDYVKKKWLDIDIMLRNLDDEKILRTRKRKHRQEIIDYIWENQSLPAKQIQKKLDEKFLDNELVYYEISKIIQNERQRRNGNIT